MRNWPTVYEPFEAVGKSLRPVGTRSAMSIDNPASVPPFPETPLDAVRERVHENVIVEGRSFQIARPADSDRLLDDPAVRAAFAVDEYMPYWTDLWPAARMLAKALMRETWPPGLEALEIG